MKTNPYLIIKQGDRSRAFFIGGITHFESDEKGGTNLYLVDNTFAHLDLDFDSVCRMINAETTQEVGA